MVRSTACIVTHSQRAQTRPHPAPPNATVEGPSLSGARPGTRAIAGLWLLSAFLLHPFDVCEAQVVKLQAADGMAGDIFGAYVAAWSDRIAVGGIFHEHGAGGVRSGAAYVFEDTGSGWEQTAELLASDGDADDNFGRPGLRGRLLLLGASADESIGPASGSAYAFTVAGGHWSETQKLVPEDAGDNHYANLGKCLAISGRFAAIGAPADGRASEGAVYVFETVGGDWRQVDRIVPFEAAPEGHVGTSILMSGNVIVAGAPETGGCVPAAGEAFVIERVQGVWVATQRLCHQSPRSGDWFGRSVAVSGQTIAIGAPYQDGLAGAVHLFERHGSEWVETQELKTGLPGTQFGSSISLWGNLMVIGSAYAPGETQQSGAAWLCERVGTRWRIKQKIDAPDGQPLDLFGYHVSLSSSVAVVGAPNAEVAGAPWMGAAYVFPVGLGHRYCASTVNSRGAGAELMATGSAKVASNDLRLAAHPVPIDEVGIFACGSEQRDFPFGDGRWCVGGAVLRFALVRATGEVLYTDVDSSLPPFAGRLIAGSTWHFQAWFRDPGTGGSGFNTTDALTVQFVP